MAAGIVRRSSLVFRLFISAMFVLGPFALAQSGNLGAHDVNGQGCFSCHTPQDGTDITGQNDLWGLGFVLRSYPGYNGAILNFDSAPMSQDDPRFHSMICLSCHDGSVAVAGMRGITVEATQSGDHPSTLLATDNAFLANDHPLDVPYTPGGSHWPGSVSSNGTFTFGMTSPSFDYGHPIRLFGTSANGGQAMVECSTCHNPHAMNSALVKLSSGAVVNKPTAFFVRGWYDVRPGGNSTTQFCRSCHYDWSNESRGLSVPTN